MLFDICWPWMTTKSSKRYIMYDCTYLYLYTISTFILVTRTSVTRYQKCHTWLSTTYMYVFKFFLAFFVNIFKTLHKINLYVINSTCTYTHVVMCLIAVITTGPVRLASAGLKRPAAFKLKTSSAKMFLGTAWLDSVHSKSTP